MLESRCEFFVQFFLCWKEIEKSCCCLTADTVCQEGLGCDRKDERHVCGTAEEEATRRRTLCQEEEEGSCRATTKVSFVDCFHVS